MAKNIPTAGIVTAVSGARAHHLKKPNRESIGLLAGVGVNGNLIRKAGVMSIVIADGAVQRGDSITVDSSSTPHWPLQPV